MMPGCSNWPALDGQGRRTMTQAVVFGLGSLFNHHCRPNVGWTRDLENGLVRYHTLCEVLPGQELCKFLSYLPTYSTYLPTVPT